MVAWPGVEQALAVLTLLRRRQGSASFIDATSDLFIVGETLARGRRHGSRAASRAA
jgi:hypothetical protein